MTTIIETDEITDQEIKDAFLSTLMLWNDNYNTFNHVIDLLIRIVGHHPEQAEQCALIVHTKGKCDVKQGSYDELKPYKDLLIEGGLNATIE